MVGNKISIKEIDVIERLSCFAAFFFYAISWTVNDYGKVAWYIGISLPWLSLLIGLLVSFLRDMVYNIEIDSISGWGYFYFIISIVYFVFMSIYTSSVLPFIPHLSACLCFIFSVFIGLIFKHIENQTKNINNSVNTLENKLEIIDRNVLQIEGRVKQNLLIAHIVECFRELDNIKENLEK